MAIPSASEQQQQLDLAAFYPKIAVAYTQIATISTDDHHTIQEFRLSVGAQWPFLSDTERIVQKDLDIREYTDPEHDVMIPHTFVFKPGLVIRGLISIAGIAARRRAKLASKRRGRDHAPAQNVFSQSREVAAQLREMVL